ncbi:MAG TPA: curli assembly protein CsgF [Castellaniella sp.]|nr:curli assembly protein CsgF [Castellaniella sp.]
MNLQTATLRPRSHRPPAALAAAVLWPLLPASVLAGQLLYTPVNPTFGGNPLNGSYLLQSAQAQKRYAYPLEDMDLGGSNDFKILNAGNYPIIQVGNSVYIYDPAKGQWVPFDPTNLPAGASGSTTTSGAASTASATADIDSGVLQ